MTLDVTIGKITVDDSQEEWVEQCPIADHDICKKEHTWWTVESYRSGSSVFREFWEHRCTILYFKFQQHPRSNDKDIAQLSPYIDEINALPDTLQDKLDADRMKWFKYWANKAVELYGDEAGIMFS